GCRFDANDRRSAEEATRAAVARWLAVEPDAFDVEGLGDSSRDEWRHRTIPGEVGLMTAPVASRTIVSGFHQRFVAGRTSASAPRSSSPRAIQSFRGASGAEKIVS